MLAKFQKSAYRLLMKISAGWDEDIMSLMNVYADWAGNCVVYGFFVS